MTDVCAAIRGQPSPRDRRIGVAVSFAELARAATPRRRRPASPCRPSATTPANVAGRGKCDAISHSRAPLARRGRWPAPCDRQPDRADRARGLAVRDRRVHAAQQVGVRDPSCAAEDDRFALEAGGSQPAVRGRTGVPGPLIISTPLRPDRRPTDSAFELGARDRPADLRRRHRDGRVGAPARRVTRIRRARRRAASCAAGQTGSQVRKAMCQAHGHVEAAGKGHIPAPAELAGQKRCQAARRGPHRSGWPRLRGEQEGGVAFTTVRAGWRTGVVDRVPGRARP